MNHFKKQQIQNIADFNPREQLAKGALAKSVPMAMLKEFQRQITGYEIKTFNGGAKFRNGDTLLAKITPCLENGKTAFVDILDDGEVAFGSTEFIVLRAKNETNPEFLYYFAISPDFRKRAIECMEGTSGRQRVNENALKTLELPIPEPQTQQSIAAVLSALDKKIALNKQINARLEEMAKTLYDYWFVQFDFPDAEGKPYKSSGGDMVFDETLKREIPKGWEVKSLWKVAKYFNGLALQKYRPENEFDDFLPVIKIREMNEGVSLNTERAKTNIPKEAIIDEGDILFSWSATLEIKIWSQGKGALNQHIFKVTSSEYPKYFFYFELLNYLKHFKMIADLRKTTMGHITQDHLKQAYICIPSQLLLEKMERIVTPIFQKMLITQKQNHQLTQLRDFLLPMLMNGQVSVAD
ncbi:restriction endonuclease subunit S [Neisseria sp. 23W00296]|uniref:restriction endonuclease subunit S n=1 Tax=unclassified Neisseria TaxID=2623750 RepID=UPI003756C136